MKINYFKHKKQDFDKVNTKKDVSLGNDCSYGCSPKPYLILCDGKNNNINLIFESKKELIDFKKEVNKLKI